MSFHHLFFKLILKLKKVETRNNTLIDLGKKVEHKQPVYEKHYKTRTTVKPIK